MKKGDKKWKKGLREVCDDRKSPFTGGAAALLGRFLERKLRGLRKFLRISRAGCAEADVRRVRLVLSSTLFDSMKTLKRYVGSLVHDRWISLSYRATRDLFRWCGVSFTVCRLWLSLDTLSTDKQKMNGLNDHSMCIGSNVKDKLATAFQLESLILAQNERWRQA